MEESHFNSSPIPPIPRELKRKAYFLERFLDGQGWPLDAEWAGAMANANEIFANHTTQYQEGSDFCTTFAQHLKPKHVDPFTLHDTATQLADLLLDGTENLDMFDLMLAVRTYGILTAETLTLMGASSDFPKLERGRMLGRVFNDVVLGRVSLYNLLGEALLDLPSLYARTFQNHDSPSVQDLTNMLLYDTALKVKDHLTLNDMIVQADFFGLQTPNKSIYQPHWYNKLLSEQDKKALNDHAAETIEKLHLLKAYRVAPIIVPADTIKMPWDILIMPPLNHRLEKYDEGAVADFYFAPPNNDRTEAKLSIVSNDNTPHDTVVLGDNEAIMTRFRLHDNGQISFGRVVDNAPNDIAEHIFALNYSHDSFVRLRGLFIALAFDALAPGDVVANNVGGSVASMLPRIIERQPNQDPVQRILLYRLRELNRQKVTPQNRQPRDWELPKKDVDGYIRALPEGTRARPQAEIEAREYFSSINVKFNGLQPGENFVKGYVRGTGPEQVPFRRASFRHDAETKRFLGSMGVRGR